MNNKRIKVYLSGAVTGKEESEYKKEFKDAKEKILNIIASKNIKVEVISPIDYDYLNNTSR